MIRQAKGSAPEALLTAETELFIFLITTPYQREKIGKYHEHDSNVVNLSNKLVYLLGSASATLGQKEKIVIWFERIKFL